ncbi:MAG: universal stress protein, partial [Streptosporangiaceae bacterium]
WTRPPPARHPGLRHAHRKETTRSNQKRELPTTSQTPKAHGIGPYPQSVTVNAVHGFVVEELINAGKGADMLVLGSRGAGGFTRLMMGSTAGQVTQHAHCPVVIIPPEDRA